MLEGILNTKVFPANAFGFKKFKHVLSIQKYRLLSVSNMGQDPIKNPLFDPGGKETDGNVDNKKEKKSRRKRGTRGKGRAVHSEEQSKQPITEEVKV